MKKVGVITICKCNNYGAELQAFATYRILTLLGYDAEIIDYIYYKTWNFKDSKMSRPLVPLGSKGKLLYWIKYRLINALVDKVLPWVNKNAKKRKKRFIEFHQSNNQFSHSFYSMTNLYNNVPIYDIYLTGSDQVWNPAASSSIEPYFLTFAPKGKKKVAYAASFGVSMIPDNLKEAYGKWLRSYDSIGVREAAGVTLAKELSGKEAVWVADPTLLLNKEQWQPFMKSYEGISKEYVLIYQLLPSVTLQQLAIKVAQTKRCKVFYVAKRALGVKVIKGIEVIYDAGPAEFLSLIANASCVITNSFHGTAFSVNFGTPFYTVLKENRSSNTRLISLLDQVRLTEHIVYEGDSLTNIHDSSFDKSVTTELLNNMRTKSLSYLTQALEE